MKTNLRESGTGAMFELGSHYYHENIGLEKDIAKGVRLCTDFEDLFNHKEAC